MIYGQATPKRPDDDIDTIRIQLEKMSHEKKDINDYCIIFTIFENRVYFADINPFPSGTSNSTRIAYLRDIIKNPFKDVEGNIAIALTSFQSDNIHSIDDPEGKHPIIFRNGYYIMEAIIDGKKKVIYVDPDTMEIKHTTVKNYNWRLR